MNDTDVMACGCSDYHLYDCPIRTGGYDPIDPYDNAYDYEPLPNDSEWVD